MPFTESLVGTGKGRRGGSSTGISTGGGRKGSSGSKGRSIFGGPVKKVTKKYTDRILNFCENEKLLHKALFYILNFG